MSAVTKIEPAPAPAPVQIMAGEAVVRAVRRIAHEIHERHADLSHLVLVGIRRGGEPLAAGLVAAIRDLADDEVVASALDVAGFRDDEPRGSVRPHPIWTPLLGGDAATPASLGPDVDGATVVLVDDVIETGRTLRAALDALASRGRPAAVELAVLIDRGGRELPMRPTYVGKNIPASPTDWVDVRVTGGDAGSGVYLVAR